MSESPADAVRDIVARIVAGIGLEGTVSVTEDGETITATVDGDGVGLLIGHHGQTIDAIQHLASRVALGDGTGPRYRIVVDADGYRARRRQALEGQADDAADEALRFQRPVALDAMTASERRVVHEHLRDREDVETHSEGDEPDRHLVVTPR
ncbi:MAG TPA: KH domain-containing protein [Solirubrobacteraceae bacterium]|nr:KH domain-containing protein [Solirubrobacteraceae bacterium]